jgi:hypothetical protein
MAQGFFAVCLLDRLKRFASGFAYVWQNLTFASCSNCDILDFRRSQKTTLHNSDCLSEYTAHTQLLLAGMREERAWRHLVAPRICCSS